MDVVRRYQDVLRVDPDTLQVESIDNNGRLWLVSLVQTVHGVPIDGTSAGFTVDGDGYLVALGADTYSHVEADTEPALTADVARSIARKWFGIDEAVESQPSALVLLPTAAGADPELELRLAIQLELQRTGQGGDHFR